MRTISKSIAAIVAILSSAIPYAANAGFLSMPRSLWAAVERIQADAPVLAPMAHVQFCLRYTDDCKVTRVIFRGGPVRLNPVRWSDMVEVNSKINMRIKPEHNSGGLAAEQWIVSPATGDCNDYAVSKRHDLLARGWPARSLLLSEVVTSWGEHHLVLVVRTDRGDFVLDNMTPHIRIWSKVPYRYLRMQTPENPRMWATVKSKNPVLTSSATAEQSSSMNARRS